MLNVNNIQRVCFHDGPGIRTTVFLNGCSLKCPWCANPETSKISKKYVINSDCKREKCPFGVHCNGMKSTNNELEINYSRCPIRAIERIQNKYSTDDLYNILIKDLFLYKKEGGVTFSGGEPLLQSKQLVKLLKKLKIADVNTTLETCLLVDKSNICNLIDYVDLFIIDIKILDKEDCLNIIGGNIEMFMENIELIFSKQKNVIFRIPLIYPYVTNKKNIEIIYSFLSQYKPLKVEIFKGHNLAREKYLKFGLDYEEVLTIHDNEIQEIKQHIDNLGIETEIINF